MSIIDFPLSSFPASLTHECLMGFSTGAGQEYLANFDDNPNSEFDSEFAIALKEYFWAHWSVFLGGEDAEVSYENFLSLPFVDYSGAGGEGYDAIASAMSVTVQQLIEIKDQFLSLLSSTLECYYSSSGEDFGSEGDWDIGNCPGVYQEIDSADDSWELGPYYAGRDWDGAHSDESGMGNSTEEDAVGNRRQESRMGHSGGEGAVGDGGEGSGMGHSGGEEANPERRAGCGIPVRGIPVEITENRIMEFARPAGLEYMARVRGYEDYEFNSTLAQTLKKYVWASWVRPCIGNSAIAGFEISYSDFINSPFLGEGGVLANVRTVAEENGRLFLGMDGEILASFVEDIARSGYGEEFDRVRRESQAGTVQLAAVAEHKKELIQWAQNACAEKSQKVRGGKVDEWSDDDAKLAEYCRIFLDKEGDMGFLQYFLQPTVYPHAAGAVGVWLACKDGQGSSKSKKSPANLWREFREKARSDGMDDVMNTSIAELMEEHGRRRVRKLLVQIVASFRLDTTQAERLLHALG